MQSILHRTVIRASAVMLESSGSTGWSTTSRSEAWPVEHDGQHGRQQRQHSAMSPSVVTSRRDGGHAWSFGKTVIVQLCTGCLTHMPSFWRRACTWYVMAALHQGQPHAHAHCVCELWTVCNLGYKRSTEPHGPCLLASVAISVAQSRMVDVFKDIDQKIFWQVWLPA
jgi:hypothetical protein